MPTNPFAPGPKPETKACPKCKGQMKSKAHCPTPGIPYGRCDWLKCGCGCTWSLRTGKGFVYGGTPSDKLPRKDEKK